MEEREIKKVSPFLWNHPESSEKEFEKLELQGWRIDSVNVVKQIGMKFYRAEPRQMRYTVHIYWEPKVSKEYIRAGQEQGWEFLGKTIGGRYAVWRKPYENQRPEPFVYDGLKQVKERQFARSIGIPAAALLLLVAVCGALFFWMEGWQGAMAMIQNHTGKVVFVAGISFALLLAVIYAIVHFRKNRD